MTADPLGMIDGPNVYAYCHNDQVNFVDPWGLCKNRCTSKNVIIDATIRIDIYPYVDRWDVFVNGVIISKIKNNKKTTKTPEITILLAGIFKKPKYAEWTGGIGFMAIFEPAMLYDISGPFDPYFGNIAGRYSFDKGMKIDSYKLINIGNYPSWAGESRLKKLYEKKINQELDISEE